MGINVTRKADLTGKTTQIRVEQSKSGPVEEAGIMNFALSVYDVDTGAVASGSIDISSISATLQKSTGGGAFTASGITQPTFSKSAGLVDCDYEFLAGEWEIGDIYKMKVSGVTATISGNTAYLRTCVWSNTITEYQNVEAKIDAIQTDIGDPSARTNLQSLEAMLGNPDTASKTVYEAVKNIRETAIDGSSTPTTNTLSDILHANASYTYDNTTDSLEANSNKLGGFSGDGGAAQDDSVKASLDLAHTDLDAIITDISAAVPEPPTAKSLQDLLHKDGSYTYDNTTDSNEAIADAVAVVDSVVDTNQDYLDGTTATPNAYRREAGVSNIAYRTYDLNNSAGTYNLFTTTTKDCVLEKIGFQIPSDITGEFGGFTSFEIISNYGDNDITLVTSTEGAKANCTNKYQLVPEYNLYLEAGRHITLKINGGPVGSETIAKFFVQYRAIEDGGYLANS